MNRRSFPAGDRPDLIAFEFRTLTENAHGQQVETWAEVFTEWSQADRTSETRARFVITYRSDLHRSAYPAAAFYKIVFDDCYWAITSAVPDPARSMTIIECDGSQLLEATHLRSTQREYIQGLAVVAPPVE